MGTTTRRAAVLGAIGAALVALPQRAAAAVKAGIGDFYYAYTVYANATARMHVTNYDKGAGQEYHIAMYSGDGLTRRAVYFDGRLLPYAGENFVYRADRLNHTIKGQWTYSNGQSVYRSMTV